VTERDHAVAEALRLLATALEAAPASIGTATATVTVTATVVLHFTPERFAEAPTETRISVQELCAATGRSRGGLYKLVREDGLPARRLPDNTFVFVVGEVRQWLREREHVVNSFIPRVRSRTTS
jgi:predicted DNA-binding transcriptional regulator AlpA